MKTSFFLSKLVGSLAAGALAASCFWSTVQAAVLTAAGSGAGFGLASFVGLIPNNGAVGPVGLVNTTGGNIMVTGYANGEVRVFSDVDGQSW